MPEPVSVSQAVLIVIDGWGHSDEVFGNAIQQAKTPTIDRLLQECPSSLLQASGEAVGLPKGQLGSSEVGHLAIGSGRVIHQDLALQQHAIKTGTFFENEVLITAIELAKERNSRLHIMGLVSPGGVHGHQDSAIAVARLAKQLGLNNIVVHAFTDGRDTSPTSGVNHVKKLQEDLAEFETVKVASISGRYYSMDRDNRWERTEQAYNMLTGDEHPSHVSAVDYINERYTENETDEFLTPISIAERPEDRIRLEDNDVVIFFNFRPDRARQLSHALVDADFSDFERKRIVKNLHLVTFTEYDATLGVPIAFPKQYVQNTLGEVISSAGYSQFHIAETEKYAHVTYFFNGGIEEPFPGEDRIMVPSPKVSTYDHAPLMSAQEITKHTVERMRRDDKDKLIVLNFANPDMVGHTGDFQATIKAVEITDTCIGEIVKTAEELESIVLVTADHGNAEKCINADRSPVTSHSINPVPFIVYGTDYKGLKDGSLQDVAPTVLTILGLSIPEEMTGKNLLFK